MVEGVYDQTSDGGVYSDRVRYTLSVLMSDDDCVLSDVSHCHAHCTERVNLHRS